MRVHISILAERIFFITVILPMSVNFLCCNCFKHFSNRTILRSKFALYMWLLLVQKVDLSELASLELHLNFRFFSQAYNFIMNHTAYSQNLAFFLI